jgi:hypothetical protein
MVMAGSTAETAETADVTDVADIADVAKASGPLADAAVGGQAARLADLPASGEAVPPTWPCHACGCAVDLSRDACPECGASFLAGDAPDLSVRLPLVGNLHEAGTATRLFVGLAAATVVSIVILAVMWLLAALL